MDVFVDDFIELAQGGPRRREALRNTLLHTIDDVLKPQPEHPMRKEAASVKKMIKGKAAWATRKTALGGSSTPSLACWKCPRTEQSDCRRYLMTSGTAKEPARNNGNASLVSSASSWLPFPEAPVFLAPCN